MLLLFLSTLIGREPTPEPTLSPAPTVVVTIATKRYAVTATPPDPRPGWVATIRRNGVVVGTPDGSSPYTRTTTLKPGTYTWDVLWKHPDGTTVTSAVTTTVP